MRESRRTSTITRLGRRGHPLRRLAAEVPDDADAGDEWRPYHGADGAEQEEAPRRKRFYADGYRAGDPQAMAKWMPMIRAPLRHTDGFFRSDGRDPNSLSGPSAR